MKNCSYDSINTAVTSDSQWNALYGCQTGRIVYLVISFFLVSSQIISMKAFYSIDNLFSAGITFHWTVVTPD